MLTYKATTKFPVRVGAVRFGLLSSDEIERMSSVEITETMIYYRGLPNPYGINDHRMGTVDRRLLCGSCGKDVRFCQGHVGHMKLSFPMYHIGFFDMTLKVLRSVCFICSRLSLSEDDLCQLSSDVNAKTRFSQVTTAAKGKKKCCHCGFVKPSYSRQALSIRLEWPVDMVFESDSEREYCNATFTSKDALSVLSYVPECDIRAMGLDPTTSHPKNTILSTMLVPPPVARPAIMASEGSRSRGQDDLTHKLQDIHKRSIDVRCALNDNGGALTVDVIEKVAKMQFEVFTYMNNTTRGQRQSTQRSGAPTKSITDRLKGKEGRIRGNLMGKRVDFSARSVITPDATQDVDVVGIPYRIAMTLTVPDRVTPANIENLSIRVSNGPSDINGAETVITNAGITIQLAYCSERSKIRLQYGWIVERYLQDNDVVIFNRCVCKRAPV